MRRYRKRDGCLVAAVQLDLITDGFSYEKWGGCQRCKRGDWLVNNNGEIYTVDQKSFSETYEMRGLGCYEKVGSVLATVAMSDGEVSTKEGVSRYRAGDYIVGNGYGDSYCVGKLKFEKMYELCETRPSDADIE